MVGGVFGIVVGLLWTPFLGWSLAAFTGPKNRDDDPDVLTAALLALGRRR